MPPKSRPPYWESSLFLSLFQKGDTAEKKYQREQAILLLQDLIARKDYVVTSTMTIAEARRGEGDPPLPGEEHATLNAFFKHEYIEVVPVDRAIAELAAEYGERYRLKPGDAVQLATAVRVRARVFLAWDGDFFREQAMKNPPIAIEKPRWSAGPLFDQIASIAVGAEEATEDDALPDIDDGDIEDEPEPPDEETEDSP